MWKLHLCGTSEACMTGEWRWARRCLCSASNGLLTMQPVRSGRTQNTQRAAPRATRHLCVCPLACVSVNLHTLLHLPRCNPLCADMPRGGRHIECPASLTPHPPPHYFLVLLPHSWCHQKSTPCYVPLPFLVSCVHFSSCHFLSLLIFICSTACLGELTCAFTHTHCTSF